MFAFTGKKGLFQRKASGHFKKSKNLPRHLFRPIAIHTYQRVKTISQRNNSWEVVYYILFFAVGNFLNKHFSPSSSTVLKSAQNSALIDTHIILKQNVLYKKGNITQICKLCSQVWIISFFCVGDGKSAYSTVLNIFVTVCDSVKSGKTETQPWEAV